MVYTYDVCIIHMLIYIYIHMHLFYDFMNFVLLHNVYMCVSRNASHTASQGWARGLKKPQ